MVVGLDTQAFGQGELGEQLADRQQDFLDLDARGGRLGRVHRALGRGNARIEQAFTPAHHLVAQARVEGMAAQVPGAIGVVIEHAQFIAVLVDGVLGEAVRLAAMAAGEAVGSAGGVVVVLIVDVVVEARRPDEHAVVVLPLDVGFGEKAAAVVDQAAFVERVVAVVAVGIGSQFVIARLGPPGEAVRQCGVPVDAQVFAWLKAHGVNVSAKSTSQHQ
ncbi:hypothetical protein D3C78_802030 [compost metagenome]